MKRRVNGKRKRNNRPNHDKQRKVYELRQQQRRANRTNRKVDKDG